MTRESRCVVAHHGDVLRDAQPRLRDGIVAAHGGEVIGEEDAGGPLRKRQQCFRFLCAAGGVVVDALPHIHIRNFQPQLIAALVEARQTVLGNGGPLAMDESDAAVALAVCRADQRRKAGHVVRKDCHPVVEHVSIVTTGTSLFTSSITCGSVKSTQAITAPSTPR